MTIIRELETFLNLEFDSEDMLKRILGLNKKKEDQPDLKRREFLGKGIAAAGVIAGASLAPGLATAANAMTATDYLGQFKEKNVNDLVPSGIAHMRCQLAKNIYLAVIKNEGNVNHWRNLKNLTRAFSTQASYPNDDQIDPKYLLIDPAIYVIAEAIYLSTAHLNDSMKLGPGREFATDKLLQKNNMAMFEFSKGIAHWYNNWGATQTSNKWHHQQYKRLNEKVEFHLTNALFFSAYQNLEEGYNKAEEFRKEQNIQKKTVLAVDLKNKFMEMKGYDETSFDPNNPYNRHLLGQTAAFWLSSHHQMKGGKNEKSQGFLNYFLINKEIEQPLRKHTYRVRSNNDKPDTVYFNRAI